MDQTSPIWPGTTKRVQDHQELDHPKVEGDELEGEKVEVVHNSIGDQSSTSPSHPPAKRFKSHIIPSTHRTFQTTLATIPTSIPPASPSSTARPALIPEVRPSPIHQCRNSPIVTSQQLQPVASSSRRREELSPLSPKCVSKGIGGLSELPDKIQIGQVKIIILWPDCSEELIKIVGK
ncbi:hypothetical protein O181_012077 [Austropuccinia psidii MF-1]|uniref:Uncharacterized protein n=1 Tax=Austropuccinia psidii MF-1 TaxID=1389203 RepID=A0A9Q3GMN9_9BASI|nr:hypothetical protein [Austropuccinia psidii MF-1]